MSLLLKNVYPDLEPKSYKLHLACSNGIDQPLDVFLRNREEWNNWNSWRGKRNDFSRDYIFSLIDYYPERHRWLFGGAYRVISRKPIDHSHSYGIELLEESIPYIGRMKIELKRPGRVKAANFEKHYSTIQVSEILPEVFTGEAFPGYDNIDLPFTMLEVLIKHQRSDWRVALEQAKGVYLITDTAQGKRYVGSAYGTSGIWSRWMCYAQTAHGYNDELTSLISKRGISYARENFRISLLEFLPPKTPDNIVINRESYWKEVLMTRGKYGYNKN